MPIVNVQMFPGRTAVMKEFLGRAIVDAVSEIAGPPRENVQVLFSDIPTSDWAIGPTLVSSRPATPAPAYAAAELTVEQVTIKPGKVADYLAWRRESVLPFLASQPGFLSSVLARCGDEGETCLLVEKWVSAEARATSLAGELGCQLEAEAKVFVASSVKTAAGRVVDVFRGRE